MFLELDDRRTFLAAVALLLLLVHMIFPGAGVDDTSILLLLILALMLYAHEAASWLSAIWEFTTVRPAIGPQSDLSGRIRDLAYQVEHARMASATEQTFARDTQGPRLEAIMRQAGGQARPALLLVWGALEDRLIEATGARDTTAAVRELVDSGRVPRQFGQAFDAFRRLRNEVAQSATSEMTEDALWALLDIGAALLALAPGKPAQAAQPRMN